MYDLVIKGGNIIDPVDGIYEANIGVENDRIAYIGSEVVKATREIDAAGCFVSPGFIDLHSHENAVKEGSIEKGIFESSVLMGVTTTVGGNCGMGPVVLDDYREALEKNGAPLNYAALSGHAFLREAVGCTDRYSRATKNQADKMVDLLREALNKGASGLSVGLEYTPGASTEELLELSKTVAEYEDRLVSVHYRFDGERALEAVAELIIVARETGVRMQISHLGSGTAFGKTDEALSMIESAYNAGVDVGFDVYPYAAFCSLIGSAVFDEGCLQRWGVDYSAIKVVEGKYCGELCTPEIFMEKRSNEPETMVVAFVMDEEEIIRAIQHPMAIIASDGRIIKGRGHPRSAGTFPRVLGHYVREKGYLELVTAIYKMTGLPAKRLRLDSRGRIRTGYFADVTIFDYENIIDRATYEQPALSPGGINSVIVNGVEVVRDGEMTGAMPGAFLYR